MSPKLVPVVAVLVGLFATTSVAATPEDKCQAKKLKLSGLYAACRLKADAKAVLKDEAPDYSKCEENLATKLGKAEEKAGSGVCPTEGDRAPIAVVLDHATREVAEQLEAPDAGCPVGYRDRDPVQVIQDWLTANSAQNLDLLLCNYHPTAHIIDDQGILTGHLDIATAASSFWSLFNGIPPTKKQLDVFEDTARLLWSLDAGWVEIEDGVDSFQIERGQIRTQTRHGLITFNGPPPD